MPKKQKLQVVKNEQITPQLAEPSKVAEPVQEKPKHHVLFFIECSADGIRPDHVEIVESKLKDIQNDCLYLVIHTNGGDVYSAVRIMRILQGKFKKIKVIVPDFAYSSGTVMSLGCDEIHMAVDATLGPLDKPIEHPGDGSEISSLDVTEVLSNLISICSSAGTSMYKNFRRMDSSIRLSKQDSARIAFDTASKAILPIVEKIDPFNLQKGFRIKRIGLNYAIDMLFSRMMKGNIRQAVDTASKLVDNFPSHGYGIFRDEARYHLNLTVHNLEDLTEWQDIEPKFEELKRGYSTFIDYSVI